MFAAHNLLPKDTNPSGYLLLQCLRSYLNIRMFADFDLHTEETISAGRKELKEKFSRLMEVYLFLSQSTHGMLMEIFLGIYPDNSGG